MRSTILLVTSALFLLASTSAAQAPVQRTGSDEVERAFREADLDGDGFLTRAEFARAWNGHAERAAAAERARLERRIAVAREAARSDAEAGADAALARRLLGAIDRLEVRLLGAGSRAAFMELRGEAIGLARAYATHPSAPVASRFLDALHALEARAKQSQLSRADLVALRESLGSAEENRGASGAQSTREERSGPATSRRASAATGMGEGRFRSSSPSAPAEARAGSRR